MKFRKKEHLKVRANADLTPLIDVVFQLLIFFMLSSTFVVQTSINIQMPEAEGTTNLEEKDITITVQYDPENPDGPGLIYVDRERVEYEELPQYMSSLIEGNVQPFVLVRPDRRVPTGRTVAIFGILNSLNITNYGIAAEPAREEP